MIKYNFTVSIFFDDRCELIGYSKWNLRGTSVDFSIVKCMYLSQKIKQKKQQQKLMVKWSKVLILNLLVLVRVHACLVPYNII